MLRWATAFDSHGSLAHPPTLRAFHKFCTWWKPTVRICGGDHFDFGAFRKGASEEERSVDIKSDLEAGLEFIDRFQPTVFMDGNHEHRLTKLLASPWPEVRALAEHWRDLMNVRLKGALRLPYNKRIGFYPLGDLKVMHGYTSGVSALRKIVLAHGNVLVGHNHRAEETPAENQCVGYSSGSLCELELPYNHGHLGTLAQSHGWAYGVVHKGRTVVWLAKRYGNDWILPSEMKKL